MRLFNCLMLLFTGCAGPSLVPATEGAPALRVLTWNVNYGVEGHPDALALLARVDADVVLLQETTPGWEAALRATFAPHYPHMRFHHCCGAGGLAVLSRHPIAREEVLPAVSWFPAWRGVVQTPLGPVQLLSVHLRPPFSDSGSVASGLYQTPPIRGQEMAAFAAALEDDVATIVAGDFNEGSGEAISQVRARGMHSVLERAALSTPTWHWDGVPVRLRLDHMFFDDDALALTAADVFEEGPSDHFPILARFELKR